MKTLLFKGFMAHVTIKKNQKNIVEIDKTQ